MADWQPPIWQEVKVRPPPMEQDVLVRAATYIYVAGGRGQGFPHVERLLMLPMPDGLNSMQKEKYSTAADLQESG